MKILVTGAAGFIGSHFVRYLLDNTESVVVGLDRIDSAGDLNRLKPHERFVFVHHDLRSEINDRVFRQLLTGKFRFDEHPFEYVVHMAAGSHVDRSVIDPVGFILDNVVGTAHLLDMLRTRACLGRGSKVLYFSTDEVFGPYLTDQVGYSPWARFAPNNPYAASKAGGEVLCGAYANTYGLPILVTHCTNVFGERQHREKFIPLVIDQVRRGQVVKIHSDGSRTVPASRFYTYVDNVSWAVKFLLQNGRCLDGTDTNGKYNISGDIEIDNLTVARKVAELLGKELRYEMVSFCANRPRHDMRYAVDDSSLRALAWQPIVSFDEGLRRVVESET